MSAASFRRCPCLRATEELRRCGLPFFCVLFFGRAKKSTSPIRRNLNQHQALVRMKLMKSQAHSSAFKTSSSPPSSGVNKGLNRGLFERSEFPKVPLFASNGGTKEMRAAFLLLLSFSRAKLSTSPIRRNRNQQSTSKANSRRRANL